MLQMHFLLLSGDNPNNHRVIGIANNIYLNGVNMRLSDLPNDDYGGSIADVVQRHTHDIKGM